MIQKIAGLFKKREKKNLTEARAILDREIERYRLLSYAELLDRVKNNKIDTYEITDESNIEYQIEVQAYWDDKKANTIRLIVQIDGGDIFAFRPISTDFIKAPNGSFVGE